MGPKGAASYIKQRAGLRQCCPLAFSAVVSLPAVKFYAIGGRDTTIDAITRKVDVYDLSDPTLRTRRTRDTALPTARAGFATAVLGREILVVGGQGRRPSLSHRRSIPYHHQHLARA